MDGYSRSRSSSDGRNMQIEVYGSTNRRGGGPAPSYDFRSYSTSYASSSSSVYNNNNYGMQPPRELKMKKAKSTSSGWNLNDPELQRKKRVASYKVYSVEGKVKGSFKKSFRWLKDRYTQVVYGWW
ncbi:uncharacterized protein A4U43_C05F20370 [Asparagus officinalis]|uniref:DUF3511 domain-containing protein n=1 Tax=Asparagus officinalis TaxID=4686 RepID=A0A5P1ET26_ASPOF|nr:uncharacterized protein LOC109840054 [Asparagus officinalis]ONK69198.1 uncharacterized protein A4U43_C05F20370 [Asparagus officinalis]